MNKHLYFLVKSNLYIITGSYVGFHSWQTWSYYSFVIYDTIMTVLQKLPYQQHFSLLTRLVLFPGRLVQLHGDWLNSWPHCFYVIIYPSFRCCCHVLNGTGWQTHFMSLYMALVDVTLKSKQSRDQQIVL